MQDNPEIISRKPFGEKLGPNAVSAILVNVLSGNSVLICLRRKDLTLDRRKLLRRGERRVCPSNETIF
jgi:hypothetical protein